MLHPSGNTILNRSETVTRAYVRREGKIIKISAERERAFQRAQELYPGRFDNLDDYLLWAGSVKRDSSIAKELDVCRSSVLSWRHRARKEETAK
jgi:hypothetical protein